MPEADLIVTNAVIHTLDPSHPTAVGMAVGDGKILALQYDVGQDLNSYQAAATKVLDLKGATVLPGLLDVHNHHSHSPLPTALSFPSTSSWEDVCAAVAAYIEKYPDEEWIEGGAFGSHLFGELSVSLAPLKALDEASRGRKVVLSDDSRHNRFANSAALSAGGVTEATPDEADGKLGRTVGDDAGHLTGLLVESGALPVLQAMHAAEDPQNAVKAKMEASRAGIAAMHARGITGFLDAAANAPLLKALGSLDCAHELRIWAVSAMLVNDRIFGNDTLGEDLFALRRQVDGPHHRPTFAKIFLDGVPTSQTGAFLTDYTGCCSKGHTTMPVEELEGWLRRCADIGLNVKVHCTGDASVRHVLDTVEKLRGDGKTDMIVHVAHGQFVHPADVARFASLDVVADISPPLWFPGVITNAIAKVRSPDDMKRMHPNRELADAGVTIAAGSDWPVSPDPNPWLGVAGLVTRTDPTGRHPGTLNKDQALSRLEAVQAYTINTAKALGLADVTGSLERGKSADFVVLDRDPFKVDEGKIAGTKVQQTWFAGEKVYEQ